MRALSSALLIVFAGTMLFGSVACAERSALWHVVHDLCVVDQRTNGSPAPCERVDLSSGEGNGTATLKDLLGQTQYLLIPTRRISGIESPELLAGDAPNYWHAAWEARAYVSARAGVELPREAVGMAINSAFTRSQDQLHIHIDCVRTDVQDQLVRFRGWFGENWTLLPFPLNGSNYLARRVNFGRSLDGVDPFHLLAAEADSARVEMAAETLVVIGATFDGGRPGFVLMARADPTPDNPAHGEDLLDHSCAIAHATARKPAVPH